MEEKLKQLFWSKVNKCNCVQSCDCCWLWLSNKDHFGYGRFWILEKRRSIGAHRVSYELNKGKIPKGLQVLHRCDVRGCIRPEHLYLGTNEQNTLDRVLKGRSARGEKQGSSKLTWNEVREIRENYSPDLSFEEIGNLYKVSGSVIRDIVRGKAWKIK